MAEISKGVRAILSVPWVYNLWGALLGSGKSSAIVVEDHMKARSGEEVLDIGCGTGSFLEALPNDVNYTGFDISEDYISQAREKFGDRATFVHAGVGEKPEFGEARFDLAIAVGVLHHLDDPEAVGLFKLASESLNPDGRLVTIDPVYVDGQARMARWMISKDRGQNVRTKENYEALIPNEFSRVESEVLDNLIRIPYTHLVMTCRK